MNKFKKEFDEKFKNQIINALVIVPMYSDSQENEQISSLSINVEGDIEIKAEASCNIHGTGGPSTVRVLLKE